MITQNLVIYLALNPVRTCGKYSDCNISTGMLHQAKKIWAEIKNRILFYQDFPPGKSATSILKTIYNYLKKKGSYMMPIIDIMLPACITALNVNI